MEKNFNDAVGAAATSVPGKERESERERERKRKKKEKTRFRRILNDSLTHQTVLFLLRSEITRILLEL